jgi:hypothetical protein
MTMKTYEEARLARAAVAIPTGTVKCAEGLGDIPADDLESQAEAYRAAMVALDGFSWSWTTEGADFWFAIHNRLDKLRMLAEAAARDAIKG